jgi:hypothetical protein
MSPDLHQYVLMCQHPAFLNNASRLIPSVVQDMVLLAPVWLVMSIQIIK